MPKLQINHRPDLTAEQVMELFKNKFQGQYEVYMTKLVGADFVVKKSGWTGVSFKLLQKPDQTLIRFGGFCPSAGARALCAGLIPALILHFSSWKKIQAEMQAFIETAPELKMTKAA